MSATNAPRAYVQFAFMIDHHFPGYIDAYFGPPELQTLATEGGIPELEALADSADAFEQAIADDPDLTPERRTFLQAEQRAMRTTIHLLAGNPLDIGDEVRRLYGVTPVWVDESTFTQAHSLLNELLPGSDPLPQRVQAFRERSRVPMATALTLIHPLLAEFRSRTQRRFDLPEEERCEITTVADQPWRAYNWYLGKRQSRIEFNQDHPVELWDLPTTVAHEAYPGHHTELTIKETRLYMGEGRLEQSIKLTNTPSALISEGIAKNALMAIASEAEIADIMMDCYARAGKPKSDAHRAWAFAQANRQLESVTDNQVLMLFRDHASEQDVMAYGMRYSLTTEEDEQRLLRFIDDPLSRSYTYNYTLGDKLVAAFLEQAADQQHAFQRLLSESLTPSGLMQAIHSV